MKSHLSPRMVRSSSIGAAVLTTVFLAANVAWALGLGLGETKEQLKLKYEVMTTDHGTGRVTVNLTIADQGRLKPLSSVDLHIPAADGTGYADLSLPIGTRTVDGKQTANIHLKRDLAERAEIHLKTSTLDGKQTPLTWYYHTIPISKYLKSEEPKN